ncbi:olfactory receptor 10AG1-like [Rhinophrynus dorsalis]
MVVELVLLGFGNLHRLNIFVFVLFLIIYILTVTGNILIISLITVSPRLHSPMYFFLCNLSLCEIMFTTNIVPNMLYVIWKEGGTMTVYGCITQLYIYSSSGSVECLLLTVMVFDRYLAICKPLRYSSIMNFKFRNNLVLWSWVSGFVVMSIVSFTIFNLNFCSSDVIDHIFCDIAPILQISSSNTLLAEIEVMLIAISLSIFPFVGIIVSYSCIFNTILRIQSGTGRQKAFSTCSSHLASVCTYFGTLFTIYLIPSQRRSMKVNKTLSLLYTFVTPLFNPIIYSLRNQEMKECFRYYIQRFVQQRRLP